MHYEYIKVIKNSLVNRDKNRVNKLLWLLINFSLKSRQRNFKKDNFYVPQLSFDLTDIELNLLL